MRSLAIWMLLFAFTAGRVAARDETIDELKSRAQNAPPQDRPHLRIRIAELQLRNADKLYKEGDVEHARAAVDEIVTYSEQARDSAVETKKHLKNVEITVRKIAERLRDIKRTLTRSRLIRPYSASKKSVLPCSSRCSAKIKIKTRRRNDAARIL